MFGIGGTELVLILLFAFLIVGPDKLPAFAKTLGKGIAKFREAQNQMNEVIETETEAVKSMMDDVTKSADASAPKAATTQRRNKVEVRRVEDEAASAAAPAAAAANAAKPAGAAEPAAEAAPRRESFTERKARYERERAERAAAEAAIAANADAGPDGASAGKGE